MTNKDNGGPAFPFALDSAHGMQKYEEGISIRDYFAAKALSGMLSDRANIERFKVVGDRELIEPETLMATAAYQMADLMLKERAK